jgi:hypothetical protein
VFAYIITSAMEQEEEYYDSQEEYFVDCCRAGELDEVKELLKNEALKIVWTSEDNNNCLRTFFSKEDMAAANGHLEVLKTIFEFIANKPTIKQELLNGKNCDGNTPLRTTSRNRRLRHYLWQTGCYRASAEGGRRPKHCK